MLSLLPPAACGTPQSHAWRVSVCRDLVEATIVHQVLRLPKSPAGRVADQSPSIPRSTARPSRAASQAHGTGPPICTAIPALTVLPAILATHNQCSVLCDVASANDVAGADTGDIRQVELCQAPSQASTRPILNTDTVDPSNPTMATITHTPLSPPPRYSVPLRPRFNTNPSPGNGSVPYTTPRTTTGQTDTTGDGDAGVGGSSNGSLGTRQGEQGIKLLPVLPGRQVDTTRLTNETNPFSTLTAPAPMDLAPSPSPALSINAIPEFPLPPRRDPFAGEAGPTNLGSSFPPQGTSSRSQPSGRPLPARPGPPKVSSPLQSPPLCTTDLAYDPARTHP